MPKRNPGTPDRRPPQPPAVPPVDPIPPLRKLRLRLVNLNTPVLPELRVKDQVVMFARGESIVVQTPLGSRIGDVTKSDLEQLSGFSVVAATIFELGLDPPLVVIEVLLA